MLKAVRVCLALRLAGLTGPLGALWFHVLLLHVRAAGAGGEATGPAAVSSCKGSWLRMNE